MITIPIWLLAVILVPYVLVVLFLVVYVIAGVHDLRVAKKIANEKTQTQDCPYKVEREDEIH